MSTSTPYDDDRHEYSRAALARLVLAHRARGLSETAGSLTVTRYDAYNGAGSRVSEATSLITLSERILISAVIYERERGSSWEDIGRYLDVTGPAAEERFAVAVEEWRTAFDVPYRLDETGRKRVPQLPTAAYDPRRVSRDLDLWAQVHLLLSDKHAVSGGLDPTGDEEPQPEPVWDEIDGRVQLHHLGTFLALLAGYTHHEPVDEGWDAVTKAVEAGGDEHAYAMAGVFESLDIRMTLDRDSALVFVLVANARSADLRLRINTLMDAFDRP
ncbi:hypothetical protein FB565_003213 [Actinoplanes lutulentus]|uniref:hypothetical protein n=1 Tax=Actinoplanes lutulentus TaxID=1287878 RepID=UPI00180709FC|nr:hypothetical protein [Actinoplanes lutulentus]MBB2943500.1 hypothetical protein [Actinoplanes lutulentus]